MANKIYRDLLKEVPQETKEFVETSVNIANKIIEVLSINKISQRQFALLLGKDESEISKWLSGTHNFTIKTICKIENTLREKIINVGYFEKFDFEKYWHSIIAEKLDKQNNLLFAVQSFGNHNQKIDYVNSQNEMVFLGDIKSDNYMSIVDTNSYKKTA